MRILTSSLLVLTIICVSFTLTALNVLVNLRQEHIASGLISMDALIEGKAHHLFQTPLMLASFPALPAIGALVDRTALLVTVGFVLLSVWLLRFRLHKSWLCVGALPLAAGPILFGVAAWALHGNTVPERAGPWLVTILLGHFYPLLGFSMLAILDLRQLQPDRVSMIQASASHC
jgi:hypothetical protein